MTQSFYTNVQTSGKYILYRGVKQGKRVKTKIEYSPTLYVPSKKISNFTNLQGEYLEPIKFGDMKEAREFTKQYDDVENFKIFGNTNYQYSFIADTHKGMVDWDQSKISIASIDIEVGSENGFPDPYRATEPITAIATKFIGGHMIVFGCGDYKPNGDEIYIKCKDEYTLCKKFLEMWIDKCPDVITGWNVKYFDIPYLVNRFQKILGENEYKKLSPWNSIYDRKTVINGRDMIAYDLIGVACLDYIELYKWYAPGGKSQESYRLDNIANVELGKKKLSYDEFDSLHQLYKQNHQKFIEYNIVDVELILELEDKLKLIELALTLAYDTKTNYDDVFAQTRMWDALIYNDLLAKHIIVPPKESKDKDFAFEGAYVKSPQVGKHDWLASFDLDGLYPHLMMQFNISPETLIDPKDYTDDMRSILSSGVSVDKMLEKAVDLSSLKNVTMTPNGQFFRTDVQGFIPKMLEEMYEQRKKFKQQMLHAKQEYENITDESKRIEIKNRIARLDNLQLAKKVSLNSAYGAFGSQYFRFFDLRLALSVTNSGQLSIRWIENKLNDYMKKLIGVDEDYIIYSDTDSIYLKLAPLVNKVYGVDGVVKMDVNKVIKFMDRACEDKIQPYITKSYEELAEYVHAYAQKMSMKREALCNKGIFTAKKRYILNVYNNEGVQYKEPKLKVMGLEMIKSSTPSVIRSAMKKSIDIMISGTQKDIHDFIAQTRSEFRKYAPEDIAFPRGLSDLNGYANATTIFNKSTPIHARGALLYNYYIKEKGLQSKYQLIQSGEKLKFIYLKLPNPIKEDVISFPGRLPEELELHQYIDYDLQFDKTFIDPIKVILNCMEWTTERSNSLFD